MNYLPIIVSVAALLFSLYQFNAKNQEADITQLTTVIVKLEAISEGVNEIKTDLRTVNTAITELRERLASVENRSKSNTNRLNAIDGRHDS